MLKVACPKCHYEPMSKDRWMCSCGHVWHTFDTLGQCPACGLIWFDTACPHCQQWSRHSQWYYWQPPARILVARLALPAPQQFLRLSYRS
ncbi:hypothetical protein BegalDRAFT_3237 [Beggiatoa alba B18LD]|uniref:Uncharacterized protein n=1 Tax=Beggiatoa alba B18LD TaxID=395493 RepID=I3CKB5_9GAMM|nr:hypothetical protein [Beggiatoa alba]EIJ44058.1 hypothetical protein BegalDRAFT_3237 [Beggiatoa alba B18LD]